MTLQTLIEKVCARLKNPDCDSPLVTDSSTYAGRIMELFKLALSKIVHTIKQEELYQIYGMVSEKDVALTGDLDMTDIGGDKASRIFLIAPTPESSTNSYKYFIDKTKLIQGDPSIKDFIPDNEIWYNVHNNTVTFYNSSGSSPSTQVRVIYAKALDYDSTFTKSTNLNTYITETLQWNLIDIIAEERLKEEARL